MNSAAASRSGLAHDRAELVVAHGAGIGGLAPQTDGIDGHVHRPATYATEDEAKYLDVAEGGYLFYLSGTTRDAEDRLGE